MSQESLFDDILPKRKVKEDELPDVEHTQDDIIRTSYLLVNVLLELLLSKGIIQQPEVDLLLEEVYVEYKRKRGR